MTEIFTFFANPKSPFSQWYPHAPFSKFGLRFPTAEHFMMWRKGVLFGAPEELLAGILAGSPRDAKAFGRQIPNFDQKLWDICGKLFVAEGNYAKFSQNPKALRALMDTRGTTLVEAAPWDKIWGIGLAKDDPLAQNRTTWLGTNWLGEVLTEVRETLWLSINEYIRPAQP